NSSFFPIYFAADGNSSVDAGGGVRNTGTLTLTSTIIANNVSTGTAQEDLSDTGTTTATLSLISTAAGHSTPNGGTGHNIISVDPLLNFAAFDKITNTYFMELKPGSIAIDAGKNSLNLQLDQLGHPTPEGGFVPGTFNPGWADLGFPNDAHLRVQ